MRYFYVDAGGRPQGPVPREQLAGLLTNGVIHAATLVAEEGATTVQSWRPLGTLLAAENTPESPAPPALPPPQKLTEPLAVWALVLGLGSWVCCLLSGPIPFIAAAVCGHLARGKIRKNPALDGGVLALIGLTASYLGIAFWLSLILVYAVALACGAKWF
jgi:hypothetical protein